MVKRIVQIIGFVLIVCFSFYYTDKVVAFFKEKDPIMSSIKKAKEKFKVSAVNAVIEDDTIIPGYNGIDVDINKSYSKMKKVNEYNPNMIYYKEVTPNVSSTKVYDKYIVKANPNKRSVSLIIDISNTSYLDEVREVLKKENINFLFDKVFISNNLVLISDIVSSKDSILVKDIKDKEDIIWAKNVISSFTDNLMFCFLLEKDDDIKKLCKEEEVKTIIPLLSNKDIKKNKLKEMVENGAIIYFEVNKNNINELKSLVNFLNSKDYKIETLDKLISEER